MAGEIIGRGYITIAGIKDGDPSVMYRIVGSVNDITKSMTGVLSDTSVRCYVYKITGETSRELTSEKTLRYRRFGEDSTEKTIAHINGVTADVRVTGVTEKIEFTLYDSDKVFNDTTLLDRETISVITDASDLEIGGRNLLLASGEEHVTGNYNIARYNLTTPPSKGDSCVFTLWGQLASSKTEFQIFNSGGMVRLGILKKIDDGVYQVKFTWTNGEGTSNEVTPAYINLYHMTSSQSGTSTVLRVKLEKGNAATDWTPAPEDIDNRVDTFDYLKESLAQDGFVEGGLALLSHIRVGVNTDASSLTQKTYAGMNGLYVNDKTIASWWGGDMIDREHLASGQSIANAATALVRMDGTGYFAKGNISWNSDGSGSVAGGKLRWDANGNVTLGAGVTVAGGSGVSDTTLTSLLQFVNGINQLIVPVDANGNELPYDKLTNSDGTTKIKAVKAKFNFYSVGGVSALGMGGATGGGSETGGGASALVDLLDVKLSNLAKGQMLQYNGTHWVNISGIATESYVNTRINALVNGAPAAYDTLKEIADVLQGNVNSIGDIMTALGNKADKTQLANYVTLGTAQTITGVKTFSANINMTSDTENGNWIKWTRNSDWAQIWFKNNADGDTDSYLGFQTGDNNNEYFRFSHKTSGATEDTVWASIKRTGITAIAFIKSGGTATQVLMADGTVQTHWKAADMTSATSDTGMITPLAMNQWTTKTFITALGTSGNYLTWTKNGVVNNITVPFATAASILNSSGRLTAVSNTKHGAGLRMYEVYNNGYPTVYGNLIAVQGRSSSGQGELLLGWSGSDSGHANIYYRNQRDNTSAFSAWATILDSVNYATTLDSRYYTEAEINTKLTNGSVTKLGTATVGSGAKPMYLNAGTPTASTSTVGAANRPVYMNAGTITAGTYTFGNASGNAPISNGTVNTNLNADLIDGVHLTSLFRELSINPDLNALGDSSHANGVFYINTKSAANGQPFNYGTVLSVNSSAGSWMFGVSSSSNVEPYFRSRWWSGNNGQWTSWHRIAFTSSNVASATKLQTARSFWGQSFDGTANVSGNMSGVGTLTASGIATLNGGATIPTGKKLTIGAVTIEYDSANKGLKVSGGGLYTDSYLSALGIGNTSGSTGGSSYDRLDNWSDYTTEKAGYVLSAKLGYSLYQDVNSLKSGAAVSVTTTGSGNAVTAISKSGTVITATKGVTFLTSHQSLTHLLKVDGSNGTAAGVSTLINKLSVGTSNPTDADYYVSQYAGGGTTTTTYHRRPVSALWNYIKAKTDANYVTLATAQTITAKKIFQAGLQANWAFINTGDPTLKIYSGRITDAKSDGNICLQTSIDGSDGETHTYPTLYGARCTLVLQPRGGQVYIGSNPDGANSAYKLYVNGSAFATSFIKSGGTASQILMANGSVTTKKTATAQTNSGWNNNSTDDLIIPTMSFIAYWNGRYSATSSNLAYCNKGAFGDIVTHAHSEYVTALGTNGNYLTWTRNGAVSNITIPYATNADMLDGQHGAYYQSRVYDAVISQYNTYDYIEFLRCVIPAGATYLRDYIVFDLTRVETGAAQCARVVLRIRRDSSNNASITFYSSNLGSSIIPELKITSDDGVTYKVWVGCVKANYDPYLAVKIVESYVYGHWSLVNNGMTGTPAGTKYNVTCATAGIASKLAFSRTLWGRPFDGSANVTGALSSVTDITMTGALKIGEATISYDTVNKCLKVNKGFYSESFVSALGLNSGSGGGGIIEKVYGSKSLGGTFSDSTLTDTFNAYTINAINTRLKAVETGGAMSVSTTGSGNAVTSVTKSGTVITFTKGVTFLTAHQSLANYVTLNTAQTISAVKTFSGGIVSTTGFIYGQGVTTRNHAIHIGHSGGDHMDFYEFGAVWNFYRSQNGTDTLIASLTATALTAPKFVKSGGTSSQFLKADGSVDSTTYATAAQLTNGSVTKLGTATVGSTSKPIYLNAGVPTALSATVGSATKPVYLSAGTITASSSTVGSGVKPIYLNAGTMTASSSTVGGTAKPVWLNAGTVTALSATVGANNLPIYLNGGTLTAVTSVGEAYLSWGGKSLSGSISPVDCAASPLHSANRLAFANPAGITIEYSRDGGSTWTDYGLTDADKISIVSGLSKHIYIGGKNTDVTVSCRLRITLNASKMSLYTRVRKFLVNVSTNGASGSSVLVERAMKGSETTFITEGTYAVSGWSGWNSIPLGGLGFGGSDSQTGNAAVYRLTFFITGLSSSTSHNNALDIIDIELIGDTYWGIPHEMAKSGHLYTYDSSKNAMFPAKVTAASFSGSLSGNASTATTLQTARSINGTNFNGSANITTSYWGTARNISIADATAANTGAAVSVNGSGNVTLKLPSSARFGHVQTIEADALRMVYGNYGALFRNDGASLYLLLTDSGNQYGTWNSFRPLTVNLSTGVCNINGNASTATKLQTARTIWGQSFNGGANISGNLTGVGSITGSGVLTLIGTGDIHLKNGNTDSRSLVLNSSAFKPFDAANGLLNLGTTTARWNGIYGKTLNLTDTLSSSKASGTYLAGNQGQAIINSTASSGAYAMLAKMNSTNGVFTHGVYQTRYELHYTASTTVSAGTNSVSNNTTLMDENGNMGIGTTAPAHKLHVAGTFYASGAASLASTLAVTGTLTHSSSVLPSGHNTLRLGSETRNYAGVHSSQFINNTNGVQMWIWQAKNNPLGFATNGVERMRIAAGGSVGIGTTAPAYLLDVNGIVNCSSLRIASSSGTVLHNSATADYILSVTAKDKNGNWFTSYQINHDKGFVFPSNVPVYAHSTLTIGAKSTLSWDSSGSALKCNTNFYSTGGITALSTSSTSDMRLKEVMREMELDVRAIASAPSFVHRWKDAAAYGCGEYAGSSAQYWLKVLPQVVGGRPWLALDYGKAALLSAIALARRSENHEQRISRLEKENECLRMKCIKYENELKRMRK